MKNLLKSPPIICFPDFKKHFYVATDASDFGLGAVLYQHEEEDNRTSKRKYIGFVARSLSPGEKNYTVTQQELVAIVFAFIRFHSYLYGRRFTVITDHRALKFMQCQKDISMVVSRWYETIMQYNFDVEYCPGVLNKLPDLLSRLYPEYMNYRKTDDALVLFRITTPRKLERSDWKLNPADLTILSKDGELAVLIYLQLDLTNS